MALMQERAADQGSHPSSDALGALLGLGRTAEALCALAIMHGRADRRSVARAFHVLDLPTDPWCSPAPSDFGWEIRNATC